MPHAHPEKSFDLAVRHLFRHLHDGEALLRNPFVKRILKSEIGLARDDCSGAIRTRILKAAAACRSEGIKSGRETQALRRHAIIEGVCAGDRPEKTAAAIGVSVRQYYRDRKIICARVARHLAAPGASTFGELREPLQLLLRRASSLIDQGFALKAVTVLEDALGRGDSVVAKVSVFLCRCSAAIQYGDAALAAESLEAAKQVLTNSKNCGFDNTRLRDMVDLAIVDVAIASGRDAEAGLILESLVKRQSSGRFDHHLSKELALDVFLESCSLHLLNGRYKHARLALSDALRLASTMDNLKSEARVFLAVMSAACCEDSSGSADESILLNSEALALSLSSSSARGVLYAMGGLVRAHLRMEDEGRAFACFQKAVQVARTMEGTKSLVSAAILGTGLISTRYWREVGPLLAEAQGHAPPGTLKSAQLQGAVGIHLARVGNLRDGLECLRAATGLARSLRNTRLEANLLREQGLVLHQLGYATDATDCIRAALALVENGTSALALRQTHSAAAIILADWKSRIALQR
jgi:tetratricopeptide (TPR) repeat protein